MIKGIVQSAMSGVVNAIENAETNLNSILDGKGAIDKITI